MAKNYKAVPRGEESKSAPCIRTTHTHTHTHTKFMKKTPFSLRNRKTYKREKYILKDWFGAEKLLNFITPAWK